jgi:esterase/lipase superfamily enzyme
LIKIQPWRCLAALLALALAGCVTGIDYGPVPHSELSAGVICNPDQSITDSKTVPDKAVIEKPMFAVTSRLPDCTSGTIKLTDFRGEKLRYARFASLKSDKRGRGKEALPTAIAFESEGKWWADLETATAANQGRLILYVHGYRENFNTSSRDSEQIARLSNFTGPVIQYSWPSENELLSYAVDETNMYWDERNFRGFLEILARKPWVNDIVVISHSLGARLVIPSIEYVDRNAPSQDASNISKIILASPDTDRSEFERDIGTIILSKRRVAAGRRMTVYVSDKDKALGLSRVIHGYPRLGRPFCFNPFEAAKLKANGLPERCYASNFQMQASTGIDGLVIVDTTDVTGGRSGHSDYLKSARACRDFASVLQGKGGLTEERQPTHLPYVFRLAPYIKGEKPDHEAICMRRKS